MPNLNRVMLMGNLTRDPELRYLPSNLPVVGVGIAINRKWKDQQGEQKEEVLFLDCDAFGKTAELINQYMRKGRPIFIEGRLRMDQWQDKEGNNRSKIKVVIENFQFIDSRGGEGGPGGPGGSGGGEGADMGEGGGPPRSAPRPRPAQRPPQSGGPGPAQNAANSPGPGPSGPPPSSDPHQPVEEEDIPF